MKHLLLFLALAASAAAARVMPAPLYIVPPTGLPIDFEGVTVRVDMTVGADGIPRDIRPLGRVPRALTDHLVPALAQWRFKPCRVDGIPRSLRIELPLELVSGPTNPVTLADPAPLIASR